MPITTEKILKKLRSGAKVDLSCNIPPYTQFIDYHSPCTISQIKELDLMVLKLLQRNLRSIKLLLTYNYTVWYKLLLFFFITATHIKMQYFTGNNIGPDGAQSIADALKINQSITELSLNSIIPNHSIPLLNFPIPHSKIIT